MSTEMIYELIGYIGSALVVISLAMSSIIRLRIVNLAGSLVFTGYGFLIGSIPVILTNVAISGLDIYYLRKELSTREELTVVPVESDDAFLKTFMGVFGDDLHDFVTPSLDAEDGDVFMVMLRDATAAGVFIGSAADDGVLDVVVDYVAPPYRDHKSGVSLYGSAGGRFADLGYNQLRVRSVHPKQADYFASMGFEQRGDEALLAVGAA